MEDIRVESLHDLKSINSINGRYCLKMCETYMYIQDIEENKVLVEVSLDTEITHINNILKGFGFPKIIINGDDADKDERIKYLESVITTNEKIIERQKNYIKELERRIFETMPYRMETAIEAYTALLGGK